MRQVGTSQVGCYFHGVGRILIRLVAKGLHCLPVLFFQCMGNSNKPATQMIGDYRLMDNGTLSHVLINPETQFHVGQCYIY